MQCSDREQQGTIYDGEMGSESRRQWRVEGARIQWRIEPVFGSSGQGVVGFMKEIRE